jgi:glycosyltransferase involved in cell wall biosynthesis
MPATTKTSARGNKDVKISVFTPTYNRGHLLERLYRSLLDQSYLSFEWIIVDDGSVDNTSDVITGFIAENLLTIRYIFKENAGKQVAINRGVSIAVGELFFIVDSDDWLPSDALETIFQHWSDVKKLSNASKFAGVAGNRIHSTGEANGGDVDYDILDADAFYYRQHRKFKGDKAEAYATKILAKYPFPEFDGEKFCPESLIWNRIAEKYRLRYFNKGIYIGDYLDGGLTDRSIVIRAINPRYTSMLYSELANSSKLPLRRKIKAIINYWRFSPYNRHKSFSEKVKDIKGIWGPLLLPVGYLYYLKERKTISTKA